MDKNSHNLPPDLAPEEARKLELRRQALFEGHKFTGEHLRWPVSSEKQDRLRRQTAAGIRYMDPSDPGREIGPGDPRLFDRIGCEETTLLAHALFYEIANAYFAYWSASGSEVGPV